MTDFHVVTQAELRPVLDVLIGLPEHVPFEDLPDIVERLGWFLQAKRHGNTNLPVSFRMFNVGCLDAPAGGKEIVSVDFRVTDTLPDHSSASQAIVTVATPHVVEMVTACLGFPPTRRKWASPGETWDLPDGKQVNVYQADNTVVVQVWAKRWADNERTAVRRGVNPAHDLDEAEWENPTGTPMAV